MNQIAVDLESKRRRFRVIGLFFVGQCRSPMGVFVFSLVSDLLARRTMMSSIEPMPSTNSNLVPNCCRYARSPMAPRPLRRYTTAVLIRLRDLAPYAAIELVLPGGSLMALLLWLYRRYKKQPLSQISFASRWVVNPLTPRRAVPTSLSEP